MVTVFTADMLGRRGSIIFGLCVMIIGKVIQASSFSLGQYIAGRVVAGFGNGYAFTAPDMNQNIALMALQLYCINRACMAG